jgi:hypothetical protein
MLAVYSLLTKFNSITVATAKLSGRPAMTSGAARTFSFTVLYFSGCEGNVTSFNSTDFPFLNNGHQETPFKKPL